MIEDLCVVVNTVSSCKDIWEMFVKQIKKHFPNQKVYVFSDEDDELFNDFEVILYNKNHDFRTQYYNCLSHVEEKYCLNMNDDYILYKDVDLISLNNIVDILKKDPLISFIRVGKGFNNTDTTYSEKLYYLNPFFPFFYSQTVAVWDTKTLLKIHELCPPSSIGRKDDLPQLEEIANQVCTYLNLKGLYYYNNENQRGSAHYDSEIFPYIASALVGGKWNLIEYPNELLPLISEYNIDLQKRGLYEGN